jgi:hypothetical protein
LGLLAAVLTRRGRSALLRLLLAMVAGSVPLLAALAVLLRVLLDSIFSFGSTGYEFPIIILVLSGFLISGGLVAVVLEGLRERRAQLL